LLSQFSRGALTFFYRKDVTLNPFEYVSFLALFHFTLVCSIETVTMLGVEIAVEWNSSRHFLRIDAALEPFICESIFTSF
jgi:hypothetical protein